ncbi:uncharacterized protein PGTG_07727 [Puccinia graminis f. sp. tritici CRL 75-36-700-3]|uniref:Zn(2)-C6 fungal-type domain-containing protein n=1 Tax=Puccinia graminis f. sp. tritici (strain CRL 75-36-700-3 / race SCCL) TaxID=418459 RepID=E3KBH2_PUCGT|nr:uncharacterized protein PGTG_07727 [Puccinia graminis f. sp. tritici CRL 75-36-700-3]EFP81478.2 hypothetical protein PGTG_07727 [Puccinia graminis f. sp. tritici CRL 75-36-700-3]
MPQASPSRSTPNHQGAQEGVSGSLTNHHHTERYSPQPKPPLLPLLTTEPPKDLIDTEQNKRNLSYLRQASTHWSATETHQNSKAPGLRCLRCQEQNNPEQCVFDVESYTCGPCAMIGVPCEFTPIQRPGYHGISYFTEVLLRRIRAEVARLERQVFGMSDGELT